MIIRSQNKKFLTTDINLEVMTPEHSSVEGRTIRGYSFEELLNGEKHETEPIAESRIYNSQGWLLATYSTEEKAIKVLDMIQQEYGRHFFGQGGQLATINHYVEPFAFIPPKVFQMPSDEEVEV